MRVEISKLHLHWGAGRYKGKEYRSYSLARAYRKNGKNRKEIILPLGRLDEENANRWRNLLRALKTPGSFATTADDIVVTQHFAYLDVAVVNAVWDMLELDDVFSDEAGSRAVALAVIARILTINRCIDPAAKSQTPEWFRSTALPWILDVVVANLVNPSRIFRELEAIERCKEAMCAHLFKRLSCDNPASMNSVFYDLSSSTFSGTKCVLMKWSHCKEGYRNHVVLALVVNRDGLPFYWEVLPGGTADVNTIVWLLERLEKRFKVPTTTLVFDRGMVSDGNLALLEQAEIKYISAMDRNQLKGVTGLNFEPFADMDLDALDAKQSPLADFVQLNTTTYYREVKVEDRRRYILCFNPQLCTDQRKARKQALEDFRSFVTELNVELRAAQKSREKQATYKKFKRQLKKKKLTNFTDVDLQEIHVEAQRPDGATGKVRTYQAKVMVDDVEMRKAGRLDGFWLLVTNHTEKKGGQFEVSAAEAIAPYREKVIIEAGFRDLKAFIEVAPIFVWQENHVKAHYSVCVLSHLINRTLTLCLHKHPGKQTSDVVSHEKLYKKLSPCQIDRIEIDNVGLSTYNMTRPTEEQKELLERVGFQSLLSNDVLNTARSA